MLGCSLSPSKYTYPCGVVSSDNTRPLDIDEYNGLKCTGSHAVSNPVRHPFCVGLQGEYLSIMLR